MSMPPQRAPGQPQMMRYNQPGSYMAPQPAATDGHNMTQQPRIPGQSVGPRLQSPTKTQSSCQMAPPMVPPQAAQGQYVNPAPPSAYYAQRSGSQPTSPKKRRQELNESYIQQGYNAPQQQMSMPPVSNPNMATPVTGPAMSGQFTPQQTGPRLHIPATPQGQGAGQPMRSMFAGQPIKNEYIQRQQVKRTSSYRERISPEKPPGVQPEQALPPGITKIPPVTVQHGFIQHLINDRSSAFRSHPLFPLLRDLIIADMNFYSPAFPFALISNLPTDFDRLLQNFMNRNPPTGNRRTSQAVENVVTDALKYAHRALIGKNNHLFCYLKT